MRTFPGQWPRLTPGADAEHAADRSGARRDREQEQRFQAERSVRREKADREHNQRVQGAEQQADIPPLLSCAPSRREPAASTETPCAASARVGSDVSFRAL